jgi:hypothetical protein
MLSSQHEEVLVADVTFALTDGAYSSSTFVVAGRVGIYDDKSELAVVGGTGQLRRAAGHVLWRTAKVVSEVYIVVELIVRMSVPANDAAPSNGSSLAIDSRFSQNMSTSIMLLELEMRRFFYALLALPFYLTPSV